MRYRPPNPPEAPFKSPSRINRTRYNAYCPIATACGPAYRLYLFRVAIQFPSDRARGSPDGSQGRNAVETETTYGAKGGAAHPPPTRAMGSYPFSRPDNRLPEIQEKSATKTRPAFDIDFLENRPHSSTGFACAARTSRESPNKSAYPKLRPVLGN